MLQIRNICNGRSEWNVNETHLIIPMIDGDLVSNKERDKILTSTVTLNTLEGSNQSILTNALEHSLVVGLDKNLFESTNYKSDLLIIQNSDLKLLQCSSDIKVAQTLSDVEQDKSENLWQNPILKDKISGNEKTIFEIRHVLNYDDIDLEKTNRQINLDNVNNGITSQGVKTNDEILTREITNQGKNNSDSSFSVSLNPVIDKRKSISISPNTNVSKTVENIKKGGKKKLFENEMCSNSNNIVSLKFEEDFGSVFSATNHLVSYSDTSPISLVDFNKCEVEKKDKIILNTNQITKDSRIEGDEWKDEENDSFWEKNLPLKKKAKMKRTLMAASSENQKTLFIDDAVTAFENAEVTTRQNIKQITNSSLVEEKNPDKSDCKPTISRVGKQKHLKLKGSNKCHLVKEAKQSLKKDDLCEQNDMSTKKTKTPEFLITKFNDIFELVECLLKCRMIKPTVWQTLNSGLKEIKVDILKEMITKRKEQCSPEGSSYSPQLKAFALVLYFKQPAAFNHLSQMYKNGWPSLKVIKEWKRRMNACRRRNFIRAQPDLVQNKS